MQYTKELQGTYSQIQIFAVGNSKTDEYEKWNFQSAQSWNSFR